MGGPNTRISPTETLDIFVQINDEIFLTLIYRRSTCVKHYIDLLCTTASERKPALILDLDHLTTFMPSLTTLVILRGTTS